MNRKAQYILFENKKDSQLLEDMELGPVGRLKKMFMLISMANFLSPDNKIRKPKDDRYIELKRMPNDSTAK